MKRKAYDKLLKWKQLNGETAILINGARRVGKSYLVQEFAHNEYKTAIIIDFNCASEQVAGLFDHYLDDLDTFFMYLSSYTNTKLYPRESVIVFDEVQHCPRARAAIKYLVADGRYDYIETGSLISIKKNVEHIQIPSEEEELMLHPMDFEEFLWAMGNEMLMPLIKHCFEDHKPMGESMHRKAMDMFRRYMIVGGMPQAVLKYLETSDFDAVDHIKRQIIRLYRNDIQKFAQGYEAKVTRIFDSLPGQLSKHEKKFVLTSLNQDARMRDYESAFFWLNDARIINIAVNTTAPNIGLGLNEDDSTLKCYMADTGLLLTLAFKENEIVSDHLYEKILSDKLEFNGGMIIENMVAQILCASGHRLFFFSKYDKSNGTERMEIDFLVAKSAITSRHNISPIEVKCSSRYTLASLCKCMAKYGSALTTSYVIHPADYKQQDGITYLPLYMAPLL